MQGRVSEWNKLLGQTREPGNSVKQFKGFTIIIALIVAAGATLFIFRSKIPVGTNKTNKNSISQDAEIISNSPETSLNNTNSIAAANFVDGDPANREKGSNHSAQSSEGVDVIRDDPQLSEEEAAVAVLDDLVGAESYKEAILIARKLMNSANAEVRQDVADNLGWIGLEALAELSQMLSDPDQDVAQSVFTHWAQALDSIKAEGLKVQLLIAGLQVVDDESSLESGVMMFDSMAEEVSVPALVEVIEGGNSVASEVAREHYEFTTGTEYTTPEAARVWVRKQTLDND